MSAAGGSEAYVNGRWLPRAQATVSAFDRGFLFGDGVYELIPAYGKRPFLADRHIARLLRSLEEIQLSSPRTRDEWLELVNEAAVRQEFPNQKIYLQVTRGAAPRKHAFPEQAEPTVVLFVDPFDPMTDEQASAGVAAITLQDVRWLRGDIKATSLLAAVLASQAAAQAGAAEAILLRDGWLTEGASSNVLVARDGTLASPPAAPELLSGITLDLASELAAASGPRLVRCRISANELAEADEIIISSSSREVVAVTSLDGKQVGSGSAGPIHAQLRKLYSAELDRLRAG